MARFGSMGTDTTNFLPQDVGGEEIFLPQDGDFPWLTREEVKTLGIQLA